MDVLHFYYDSQARPAMVSWNGVIYTYVHNLQGDIIAILDNTGAAVVTYSYDPWGALLAISGSKAATLGKLNPFRYRSYVYDDETGLYYLRSRYYKPEWCRFINADTVLGKVGAVGSHNLFAYCGNNPVVMADPDGLFAQEVSKGWEYGSIFGPWVGLGCAALLGLASLITNPPKISLPKISTYKSSTTSVAQGSDVGTLWNELSKAEVDTIASTYPHMIEGYYYIAFTMKQTNNSVVFVFELALTKEQANLVLATSGFVNTLVSLYRDKPNGFWGVYTPNPQDAVELGKTVGCVVLDFEEHFSNPNAKPGVYYYHLHDPSHTFHIWTGVPMYVGL